MGLGASGSATFSRRAIEIRASTNRGYYMRIFRPVNNLAVSRNLWLNLSSETEQRALKNVNNCLYTKIYSYIETSGGISYN
jgi:hypothetical protein